MTTPTGTQNVPPSSNKGGTQVQPGTKTHNPQLEKAGVQAHLDWLTYTVAWQPSDTIGQAIGKAIPPEPEFSLTGEIAHRVHGYSDALKLGIGAVSYSPDDQRMKICTQFTGKDWQLIDQANIQPEKIIQHIARVGGKPTRIDFALDLFAPGDPAQIYKAWHTGKAKTRAQSGGQYLSARKVGGKVIPALTAYIGDPTSYQQLRVYDKAKEQRVDYDWIRIELVTRDKGAKRLADGIAQHGVVAAGQQAVRDFFRCEVDWYIRATEGKAVHLAPIAHDETDTRRWLIEQVFPIIERELIADVMHHDGAMLHKLERMVKTYASDQRKWRHMTVNPPKRVIR